MKKKSTPKLEKIDTTLQETPTQVHKMFTEGWVGVFIYTNTLSYADTKVIAEEYPQIQEKHRKIKTRKGKNYTNEDGFISCLVGITTCQPWFGYLILPSWSGVSTVVWLHLLDSWKHLGKYKLDGNYTRMLFVVLDKISK